MCGDDDSYARGVGSGPRSPRNIQLSAINSRALGCGDLPNPVPARSPQSPQTVLIGQQPSRANPGCTNRLLAGYTLYMAATGQADGPPPLAKEPMKQWPEFWSAEDYDSITPLFDGAELVPAFTEMQGHCPLCFFTGQNHNVRCCRIGREHLVFCWDHRLKWPVDQRVLDERSQETDRARLARVCGFVDVKPVYPLFAVNRDPPLDDVDSSPSRH